MSSLRSISLPSSLKATSSSLLEEELKKVKAGLAEGGVSTTGSVEARVVALSDLYAAFTELIQTSPSVMMRRREESLEASDSLINTCSSCRELVSSLKDYVRDLQSALRRRGSCQAAAAAYVAFRKKCKKEVANCIKELKRTQQSCRLLELDADAELLIEVVSVSIATLRSVLSLLSSTKNGSSSSSARWSMISRALKITSRAAADNINNEMESVDCAVRSITMRRKQEEEEEVKRRLRALDSGCHSLENALDGLFRRFVQNRVSILNIITNSSS